MLNPYMVTIWVLVCALATLLLFLGYLIEAHRRERQDLYNRLMCRDLGEYKTATNQAKPSPARSMVRRTMEEAQARSEARRRGREG